MSARRELEGVVELIHYGDAVEINVGGVDVADLLEACEGKQVRVVIEVGDRSDAEGRPSFVRWLLMGRAKQDAYIAGVFERKGWTPEEAIRAASEVRAAARGIPHSPWFREKLEAMP